MSPDFAWEDRFKAVPEVEEFTPDKPGRKKFSHRGIEYWVFVDPPERIWAELDNKELERIVLEVQSLIPELTEFDGPKVAVLSKWDERFHDRISSVRLQMEKWIDSILDKYPSLIQRSIERHLKGVAMLTSALVRLCEVRRNASQEGATL